MVYIIFGFCFVLLIVTISIRYKRKANLGDYIKPDENLKVTSKAFKNNGEIPIKHTGFGRNISPELKIHSIDPKAKSIAVIMDDMDHPIGVYNHWLIWNIPSEIITIPENIPREKTILTLGGAVQGKSAYFGKHYYQGPKPPFGSHRYMFKVYTLDIFLNLETNAGKAKLQKTMAGHVLQYGTLTGDFHRELF